MWMQPISLQTERWLLPVTVPLWMRSTPMVLRNISSSKGGTGFERENICGRYRQKYVDFRNEEKDAYRVDEGLTPAIVAKISEEKNDPVWMSELQTSFSSDL